LSCFVAVDDGKTDFVVSPTYDVQKWVDLCGGRCRHEWLLDSARVVGLPPELAFASFCSVDSFSERVC
jgi:hypothetical protein